MIMRNENKISQSRDKDYENMYGHVENRTFHAWATQATTQSRIKVKILWNIINDSLSFIIYISLNKCL